MDWNELRQRLYRIAKAETPAAASQAIAAEDEPDIISQAMDVLRGQPLAAARRRLRMLLAGKPLGPPSGTRKPHTRRQLATASPLARQACRGLTAEQAGPAPLGGPKGLGAPQRAAAQQRTARLRERQP